MATNRTITPANPQIFNPDALEQIYAKGMVDADPMRSGLLFAMLKNQQGARSDAQSAYLEDLHSANALNAVLEQADITAGLNKTIMQQGVEASDKLGIPLDALKAFQMLVSDPAKAGAVAGLTTEEKRAKIAELNARAANAGKGGAPSVETSYNINPLGVEVKTIGKKGATVSEDVLEKNRQIARRLSDRQQSEYPEATRRMYRQSMGDREAR